MLDTGYLLGKKNNYKKMDYKRQKRKLKKIFI